MIAIKSFQFEKRGNKEALVVRYEKYSFIELLAQIKLKNDGRYEYTLLPVQFITWPIKSAKQGCFATLEDCRKYVLAHLDTSQKLLYNA